MEKEIVNKSTHKKNKTLIFLIVILLLAGLGVGIYFLVTNLSKQTCIIRTYYGDVLVETFEVKEGDSFDLNQITYEGYEIIGIYDNRELSGDALTGKIKIKKNINLFLNCERLFNIKLVNDTEIINVYGKDGEVVQNPMIPAKEHAKFLGWGLNGEIILSPTLPYVINTSEFSDYVLTLTAIWEDAFVLSFNMNGGQQIENMYAFSGESLTLPAANRDHYVFIGWKTDDDIILNVGDKIELFSNKILYATWREEQYTISFDTKDNGIIDSIDVHYGEEINLLAVDAVGMVFNGWNFNYQIFSSNNQFIVPDLGNDGEVVCFVANFSPEIYYLNFNSNGGNVINKIKITYNDEIVLPIVSKEGYTFAGWDYNGKTLKDNYIVEDFGENECNVNLNAIWVVEKYIISFDGLGYQEFDDLEVTYGQTWNLPDFPTIEGYDFNGWTLNNSILNGYVPDLGDNGEKFIAVADLTIKSYTFILNLNGGNFDGSTELVKTIQANYGDDISFPVAVKEGYDFLGWECEDKLFSGNYKVEDLDDYITKNPNVISCNALWDPHTITITFDYGEKETISGAETKIIFYIVGSDTSNFPTPIYVEPYYFVGWSENENEYKNPNLTKDTKLYAFVEEETAINAFGIGTAQDPYRIYNNEQIKGLQLMGKASCLIKSNSYLKFMEDLEISRFDYNAPNDRYSSTTWLIYIDGNGKTLSLSTQLFNYFGGEIKNLNLKFKFDYVQDNYNYFSFIMNNKGVLDNISILKDNYNISIKQGIRIPYANTSLICRNNTGRISNCNNYADINIIAEKNPEFAIFSSSNQGIITNCNNYGSITAGGEAKVAIFSIINEKDITYCNNYGNLNAYRIGVIAYQLSSSVFININNCNVSGSINISGDISKSNILGSVYINSASNLYINNINYTCDNLNLLAIIDVTGMATDLINLITDMEEIKTVCNNVDFNTIIQGSN